MSDGADPPVAPNELPKNRTSRPRHLSYHWRKPNDYGHRRIGHDIMPPTFYDQGHKKPRNSKKSFQDRWVKCNKLVFFKASYMPHSIFLLTCSGLSCGLRWQRFNTIRSGRVNYKKFHFKLIDFEIKLSTSQLEAHTFYLKPHHSDLHKIIFL
jgi:hypothetical protein